MSMSPLKHWREPYCAPTWLNWPPGFAPPAIEITSLPLRCTASAPLPKKNTFQKSELTTPASNVSTKCAGPFGAVVVGSGVVRVGCVGTVGVGLTAAEVLTGAVVVGVARGCVTGRMRTAFTVTAIRTGAARGW